MVLLMARLATLGWILSNTLPIIRILPLTTVGGAIFTTLTLVSFSCVREFIHQKCVHALVPL